MCDIPDIPALSPRCREALSSPTSCCPYPFYDESAIALDESNNDKVSSTCSSMIFLDFVPS